MRYTPTTRTCLDCARPFFDSEPRATAPTRCRTCETAYQCAMARLWLYVQSTAAE